MHRQIWMGNKEQGRARTGGYFEEERVGGRGHVLPEEGEPHNHLQERTAQDRARPTGGATTAAEEGEKGLQSVGGRVCHHTAQTGRFEVRMKKWKEKTIMGPKNIKGALYRVWCGVNRLGDIGVKVV